MMYIPKLLICLFCTELLFLPNTNQATTQPTSDNIIHNDAALSVLFDKMYQLASSQQQPIEKLLKVPIVHIGDSHLQTGVLTSVLRERLQMQFGNAGRGLIFPYQVAKTNEPVTFVSSSNVIWEAKRCVFPDRPMPIGLSGITNNEMLNYPDGSFKRVMYLSQPTNNLQLYCRKNKPEQQYAHLYGISLEKAQSGILYHTIAVNGTQYQHLDAAAYFTKQIPELEPFLIILSLGTNYANNPCQLAKKPPTKSPNAACSRCATTICQRKTTTLLGPKHHRRKCNRLAKPKNASIRWTTFYPSRLPISRRFIAPSSFKILHPLCFR